MKRHLLIICCFLLVVSICSGQNSSIPIWPNQIPNQKQSDEKEKADHGDILWITNVQEPELDIFLPTKRSATGKAIVICPGGGYEGLAYDWEGSDIAKWLNAKGIAAFVLKYRLPISKSIITPHKAPLQDAQRALRLVRENAEKWNINKDEIGIMGFSAGGHLASTLGTHYDEDQDSFINGSISLSGRPDFMILVYPVISMKSPYVHQGSRNKIIGDDKALIEYYSTDQHVDENTPPTFLVHSGDDQSVPVMNSILFYQALIKNKVSAEMHIYPEGGHGYSLALGQGHLSSWPDQLIAWIHSLE